MINDVNQLAKVYGAADLFVIPSLEDNLPNTVMEALACGTPVVGFETGGIPEMVDHRENGFIASQCDSKGLAGGIVWVSENKEKLRTAARSKALQAYANAVVAQRHIALYRQLLGK